MANRRPTVRGMMAEADGHLNFKLERCVCNATHINVFTVPVSIFIYIVLYTITSF